MAATEAQVARLRRLCAEPDACTYDDAALAGYVEAYPLQDSLGRLPDDHEWTATYDLYAAAADICDEKAAAVAAQYDFSADGGTYTRSQEWQHWRSMAQRYRARRAAKAITLVPDRPYVLAQEVREWDEEQLEEGLEEAEGDH